MAVLVAALGLLVAHVLSLSFFTEDDAYIVARYARNLALGRGFVYNLGEREWGSTTTLLPVLLAPFHLVGFNVIVVAKVIGALSAVATSLLVWRLAALYARPHFAALASLPVAAFGPLVLWSVGGLETALFVALLAAAILATLGESGGRTPASGVPRSAILLLLATLTRDDAPAYAPLLALGAWDPRNPSRLVRWLVTFTAGFLMLWILHAGYFGAWVPNPFLAKVAGIEGRLTLGWQYLRDFAMSARWLLLLVVPAAVLLLARPRAGRRRAAAILTLGGVQALAYPVWTGGDWMPLFRLYAPVIVFAAPLLVWGAEVLAETVSRRPVVAAAGGFGVFAFLAVSLHSAVGPWTTRLHVLRTANDAFLQVGALAAGSPANVTYALSDIGGFGWTSDARILDTGGLVARRIALRPHGPDGPVVLPELLQERPDVVLALLYVGADAPFKRALYSALRDLDDGPLERGRVETLLRYPRARPNVDALAFVRQQPDYQLVNIAIFRNLPQFYLVFVRTDALARVPRALLTERLNHGIAEYEVGDRATGLRLLQQELDANPYDELGLADQAARLLEAGQTGQARATIARAIALAPRSARYHRMLGDIDAREERFEDAVRSYRASVRLDRTSAEAYNNLGFYLGVLGRYDEAREALLEALRLRPDFPLARRNLAWVERERKRP